MSELKNERMMSLNAKIALVFDLVLESKLKVTVQEFVFHYAMYSCEYLKKQLMQISEGYYQGFLRYATYSSFWWLYL